METKVLLIAVLFLGSIWVMPFGIVHASTLAVSSGLPGVVSGDSATYVQNTFFQTSNETAFTNPFEGSGFFIVDTTSIGLRIIAVSGSNVTFTTTFYFRNGTSVVSQIVNLNLQTQSFCETQNPSGNNSTFCFEEQSTSIQPIIAAGLQAPDAIGSNSVIRLNQTVAETVLGTQRTLNILNETSVSSFLNCSPQPCVTVTETASTDIAWDQASGIIVGVKFSAELNSSEGSATEILSVVMASTNIWATSIADFSETSNPSSVTVHGGGPGSSTITLTSMNGFSGTISLQASTSSALLSCSLSATSVTLSSSDTSSSTISCRGSQGTYSVTVTASAGNVSHSTTLTYTVLHGRRGLHS